MHRTYITQLRHFLCVLFHRVNYVFLFIVRKEIESLQRTLQDKSEEISSLHKQVADAERDKHTEVVKLRLEVTSLNIKLLLLLISPLLYIV